MNLVLAIVLIVAAVGVLWAALHRRDHKRAKTFGEAPDAIYHCGVCGDRHCDCAVETGSDTDGDDSD
jgi:hypothetical protein